MKRLLPFNSRDRLSRRDGVRAAVLRSFALDASEVAATLGDFSEKDWIEELEWLDVSGLALYLLDHLRALGQEKVLPRGVLARLRQNLADNRMRTDALLAEAVEINWRFQREGILFANLKGITLCPDSVHDPALRCQLDLDFMICDDHADAARAVLESMGYSLVCKSGKTWEFKAGGSELAELKDFYKVKPQRSAELHLAPADGVLVRAQMRVFFGSELRALASVDQYLAQARHLFKHLCSPHTRAGWVLEARRHMLTRRGDAAFWKSVEECMADQTRVALELAVVSCLIAEIFGDVLPVYLAGLVEVHVSQAMRLWVSQYGRSALLSGMQGSKQYLLLHALLPGNETAARRKLLVPLGLPPMITQGYAGETIFSRMKRYRIQSEFVMYRLRFHCVEGVRYFVESFRFRRLLKGVEQ